MATKKSKWFWYGDRCINTDHIVEVKPNAAQGGYAIMLDHGGIVNIGSITEYQRLLKVIGEKEPKP